MSEETDAPEGGAEGVEPSAVEATSEATTEQDTATETAEQPDAGEATEEPVKKVPWFQKRIDEVTAKKYEAEREASYWKGIAEGRGPAKAPEPEAASPPTLEQFDYDEAKYQAALTKHITEQAEKAIDEKLTRREREQTEAQKNESAIAKLRAGEAKHPDFIASVSSIKASEAVRDFLLADDNAPSVLYELGKDSAAAERFNTLSPVQQAIELGKRAATPKAAPVKTIAPPPPTTVAGLVSGIGKTPDQMSMAEYAQWVKERDKV